MIRVNVIEGIKPPLPPASGREILQVIGAAIGFCAIVGAVAVGVVALLSRIF